VTLLAFSPDGARLFVGFEQDETQGELHVLDALSGALSLPEITGLGTPWDIQFPENPGLVLILTEDGQPVLWDLESGRELWRLHYVRVRHMCMCSCGSRFAVVSAANRLGVHAIEDGRQLITLGAGQEPVAFDPGSRSLVSIRDNMTAGVFHAEDWRIPDQASAFARELENVRKHLSVPQ
jgi:hypothetical protein